MENELKYGGLIEIGEKETDYILGSDLFDKISDCTGLGYQPKYEYNQGAQHKTRNWCTVYSAVTELSYLFDREFSLTEIYEIGDKMIEDGKLNPDVGAYLSDSIDYTRNWWNLNFPEKKISSYRFNYKDKGIREAFKKAVRLTQLGYRTSSELYRDLQDKDKTATKKDYPKGGGHAVSVYGLWIIDNYKGVKINNRYVFQYFDDLLEKSIIYPSGYIFLKN